MYLSFYPHYLYVYVTGESTQTDTGSWTPVEDSWSYVGRCRQEPNGRSADVSTQDERSLIASSMIYAPVGTPKIEAGTKIRVCLEEDGEVLVEGECMRTSCDRLHTRIWM